MLKVPGHIFTTRAQSARGVHRFANWGKMLDAGVPVRIKATGLGQSLCAPSARACIHYYFQSKSRSPCLGTDVHAQPFRATRLQAGSLVANDCRSFCKTRQSATHIAEARGWNSKLEVQKTGVASGEAHEKSPTGCWEFAENLQIPWCGTQLAVAQPLTRRTRGSTWPV